jgi:hypothetical protein
MQRLKLATCAVAVATGLLAFSAPAGADLMELKWTTEGYYRARSVFLTNLAPQPNDFYTLTYPVNSEPIKIPEIRRTSYLTHRLRIMPSLSYEKLASLHFQVDAIDDVLLGDNNGLSSAPLFATDATNQNFLGGQVGDSVTIPRAWVQFQVPVGIMRVGRMPSHWGMGLLANGGGTGNLDTLTPPPPGEPERKSSDFFFDDDFGDNHFGSTADRILFITKPLSIVRTVQKAKNVESNFIVGYAYDKLSEAPLLPAEPFERRFRPFGQQGFISRGRNDDATEHVVLAVYSVPDWDVVRYTDQFKAGVYGVLRTQREGSTYPSDPDLGDPTANCSGDMGGDPSAFEPCEDDGSKVFITDFWYKVRYGPWYSEAEGLVIFGNTFGGVPFPSKNRTKKALITSGVLRVGHMTDLLDLILEVGHASGDENLEDETFKQRAMHPDYNVGLILYEEILREQTARAFLTFFSDENPEGAQGFMSKGGVINSNYVHPKVRWRPGFGGFEIIGALLMAWIDDRPDTGANGLWLPFSDERIDGDDEGLIPFFGDGHLGTEIDVAAKTSFAGKMMFSLESGLLVFGDGLRARLTEAKTAFTLQTRLAFMW